MLSIKKDPMLDNLKYFDLCIYFDLFFFFFGIFNTAVLLLDCKYNMPDRENVLEKSHLSTISQTP